MGSSGCPEWLPLSTLLRMPAYQRKEFENSNVTVSSQVSLVTTNQRLIKMSQEYLHVSSWGLWLKEKKKVADFIQLFC